MSTGSNFFDFQERLAASKREARAPVAPSKSVAPIEPLSVSKLTQQIDRVIKNGMPNTIHVKGEVSNLKLHGSSGHTYFTLKDPDACIDCVMWKSDAARLKFKPTDGMELIARGFVGVYGARGRYQLYTNSLQPIGVGALELAFKQLHAKLLAEGLFDPDRKRPIPRFPSKVAIVTSQETAALQDILKVLRRFPCIHIYVYNVPVQGDGSAEKIVAALDHLAKSPSLLIDTILLARGGGSLEDLWEFNEEILARAIARCPVPIITGIGHEIDTSIADLVADHHTHTPTEAAQVLCSHWRTARNLLDQGALRLRRETENLLQHARHRLNSIERHEAFRRPLDRINNFRQLLDDRERAILLAITSRLRRSERFINDLRSRLECSGPAAMVARLRERIAALSVQLAQRHPRTQIALSHHKVQSADLRLQRAIRCALDNHHQRVESFSTLLHAVGPEQVLARGYSITFLKKGRTILRGTTQLTGGEKLITRLPDGEVESTADDPQQPKLFD